MLVCAVLLIPDAAVGDPLNAKVPSANAPKRLKDQHFMGVAGYDRLSREAGAPAKLDRIAKKHGKTSAQLRAAMQRDNDISIDSGNEALIYVCKGLAVDIEAGAPAGAHAAADGSTSAYVHSPDPDAANAFKLHSRPGARKIIFLDFDGEWSASLPSNLYDSGQRELQRGLNH